MHNTRILYCGVLLLLAAATSTNSTKCSRLIEGTVVPRSNAENKYHFYMTLLNRSEIVFSYMPNTRYSVVLKADSSDQMHRKFTRFLISAEAENMNETTDVGVFDLQDDAMTKFAENCVNTIVETSKMQKEKISVVWTSPAEDSGCILLRATVLETIDTWYMDDPNLVLSVCQDSKAEADDQGPILNECCACDEAKFEVTFEGLWSRNTHPKDFPSKSWLIRFSDVIGASHSGNYRFWHYNGKASVGLRQVAQLGATRKLESELKNQSEHIRTIIKARGISYPNVTGKTFAVFRVDRKHHLMSLVSMIDPSPDWFVGVSALELCLPNCTWLEHKQLNLYPYDAGTDAGVTYTSPDSPMEKQESIRRITSTYPNDSRSPFYDPSGLDMKPLAKLYLNRQRLYEKTCDDSNDTITDTEACKVSAWGDWSPCSATCGRGFQLRQRHYVHEATTKKCSTIPITGRRTCYSTQNPHCDNNGRRNGFFVSERCKLTEWGSWSSCSSICGKGSKTRSRALVHKTNRKYCRAVLNGLSTLQQSDDCVNRPCEGEDMEEVRRSSNLSDDEDDDYTTLNDEMADDPGENWLQRCPADRYTTWSMWSACTASCGIGTKVRSRQLLYPQNLDKDDEKCKSDIVQCTEIPNCNIIREEVEEICSEPLQTGNCNGNILRTYFDKQTGRCNFFTYTGCNANRNNFANEQDCYKVCSNFQKKKNFKGIQTSSQIMESSENGEVDCEVSEWSKWSRCENCHGYTISTRQILIPAKNGGKNCPKKIVRRKKCRKIPPCSLQGDGTGRRYHRDKNTSAEHEISVDCQVTPWSTWSKCSATCGEGLRSRVRTVMVKPRGDWAKLCPTLAEFKTCQRVDCPQ